MKQNQDHLLLCISQEGSYQARPFSLHDLADQGERASRKTLKLCEEAGPSTQGSKTHPCSIYTASGKMPPGSWTCPSGRLHQSGISLGEAQLLYLKSLFCQCFQSSSFSKGLTAFSYTNQTKKDNCIHQNANEEKADSIPMVIHLFGEALNIYFGSQT